MSSALSNRKRNISIVAPALAIFFAYHVAFYRPLQVKLQAEIEKLSKIESAVARKVNLESSKTKLAAAQAEIALLTSQLDVVNVSSSHLVSRRDDLRSELIDSRLPATVMTETLALLNRHALECLDSGPVVTDRDAAFSPALKPVADMLGGAPKGESPGRREMRIRLRGRFQDIQSALQEMQVAPLGIFTVSLEMEVSDEHTNQHIWILTVAV